MDFNNVYISGHLTGDPVMKEYVKIVPHEVVGMEERRGKYVNFSVAVKNGEYEPDFIDCVIYGDKKCEIFVDQAVKGSAVHLGGKLKASKYQVDGERKTSVKVLVDKFDVVSSKKDRDSENDEIFTKSENKGSVNIASYKETKK